MKAKIKTALAITAAVIIAGCGDSSSISDADINYTQANIFNSIPVNVSYTDYYVNAVDDNITGANVSAPECNASKELKPGLYVLENCVAKPSYILVEGGTIGDTNVTQSFPLVLNVAQSGKEDGFVVSPLTTLLADANSTTLDEFARKLGITKEKLFESPDKVSEINMTKLNQKINAIYLKAEADGAIANKLKFVQAVRSELINTIDGDDFNVTDVAENVQSLSINQPQLFGLVFLNDLNDSDNILDEIQKSQQPETAGGVTFLGLVFDKQVVNANIKMYRTDTNEILAEVQSDEYGKWTLNLDADTVNEIKNGDFVVMFEAVKGDIKLSSSMSSKQLALFIDKNKKLTASKSPDLVISNVTTVENAILSKRGALQTTDITSYENNRTNLKTYYSDKILKTAAVVKVMVDKLEDNESSDLLNESNSGDTFDFIVQNVDVTSNDINLSKTIADQNTTDMEENITSNAILKRQIDYVPSTSQVEDGKLTFEKVANNEAGNTFYRFLAYYEPGSDGVRGTSDDVFVREYTKIVTFPGYYETTTCTLTGDSTSNWNCSESNVVKNANFTNGNYSAVDGSVTVSYSLENNESVFMSEVCKSYNLYEVSKQTLVTNEIISTEPEVLFDSYDLIDMFRRMPSEDVDSFNDLKNLVKGMDKTDVNILLNRYVRDQLNNVQKYFADSNSNTICTQ